MAQRIVVTGANGAVGRELISRALERSDASIRIIAAVRSEAAAQSLPPIPPEWGRVETIAYDDPETLVKLCDGAAALVHLPGVLIERPGATYEAAHVETTAAAVRAASTCRLRKLVLVSSVGADPDAPNRYFRTKGEAERIVSRSEIPYTVLRAPLLLGPRTEAARALARYTASGTAWLLGGGSTWHQPLDAGDLAEGALRTALDPQLAEGQTLELACSTRLRYRDLVGRAADLRGTRVRIRRVPVRPVRWSLALRDRLGRPGFSVDALEVILTDTTVDAEAAPAALGFTPSSLDESLRRSLLLPVGA